MMTRISNGEPVVYTHQCSDERKGHEMTYDELHDFAISCLKKGYADCGILTFDIHDPSPHAGDFTFRRGESLINVKVVCRDGDLTPEQDASPAEKQWLLDEYEQKGIFPRITYVYWFCFDAKDGKTALCGSDFCFKFLPMNWLPNETNIENQKYLSDLELARLYAHAWETLDCSSLIPYLDKDFHYGSEWVFDELPSRLEYLDYFKGKLETIKKPESHITVEIGRNDATENFGLLMTQNGNNSTFLEITTNDGLIQSARKSKVPPLYRPVSYADEICQVHGNHIGGVIEPEVFLRDHIQTVLSEASAGQTAKIDIRNNSGESAETTVVSLLYGSEQISLVSLLVQGEKSFEYRSTYPQMRGAPCSVVIDEVLEWSNRIEATILCHYKHWDFAFFATDYVFKKEFYKVGRTLTIDLAGLALYAEESPKGFEFTGQDAVNWLAKIGKQPTYTKNGDIEPVRFSLTEMVAFLMRDKTFPDEYEFQSPVRNIHEVNLLNVPFYVCDIDIFREDENGDVSIPLYLRQEFLHNLKAKMPVRGVLWLSGRVSEC